jgi:hypothetical protein
LPVDIGFGFQPVLHFMTGFEIAGFGAVVGRFRNHPAPLRFRWTHNWLGESQRIEIRRSGG